MKRHTLLTAILLLGFISTYSQCPEIECPSNIILDGNSGECGAIVSYEIPLGTNPCGFGAENITLDFYFTGDFQVFEVPQNVSEITYDIAGASGGFSDKLNITSTLHIPGNGGRLQGTIEVIPGQLLYLYIGGEGVTATNGNPGDGGYNGGGSGTNWEDNSGGGGGGSTDIRTVETELESRIVVAPGGGGAGWNFSEGDNGGNGGGQNGDSGFGNYSNEDAGGGLGGSQTSGGTGGLLEGFAQGDNGSLGIGGSGAFNTASGGAGSGYYGGGGGSWAGGGGGSNYYGLSTDIVDSPGVQSGHGYIKLSFSPGGPTTTVLTSGFESGENFPIGTTTVTYEVTDELDNSASCSFEVTILDIDDPSIVCPDDISVVTDPEYCTAEVFFEPLDLSDLCSSVFWEVEDDWVNGDDFPVGITEIELVAIDGYLNESTCSFEIEVLDNQSPGIVCPNDILVLSEWGICSAVVEYAEPYGALNCSGTLADSTVFEYTGDIQSWVIPEGVEELNVKLYGASSGGSALDGVLDNNHNPGKGGFLTATVLVTPGETIYINVGGKGSDAQSTGGSGGYNGGGDGNFNGGFAGGGGGGATDIRIGGIDLENRALVSGGGGGAAINYVEGDHGGPGGLEIAGNGFSTFEDNLPSVGKGGSDVAGGAGGQLEGFEIGEDGGLGYGGEGAESSSGGGGGGGYYGGGGGSWAGGGGGSSYYGDSLDIIDIPGFHEGNGIAVFSYSSIEITTSMVSGLGSGAEFPLGINTETYMAEDELGNSVMCSFDITVLASFTNVFIDGTTLNAEYPNAVYQWLDCENDFSPIVGETEQTFEVTEAGTYAVSISVEGCTVISSCINFDPVWIYPIDQKQNEIEVFPNPSNGMVNLVFTHKNQGSTVRVSDLRGTNVYSETIHSELKKTLDLRHLSGGIYVLEITTNLGLTYHRIIIE